MRNYDEFKKRILKDTGVLREYDALEYEFDKIADALGARLEVSIGAK
jgi:hypothetical protein